MSTYSTSITNGITLTNFAAQNPVTITHTGTIAPPGTNAIGVHGTGLFAWTIDNDGLISTPGAGGVGVYLPDGGLLTNQTSAAISANATSGVGVLLNAGGTVTNQTSAAITGYLGIYDRNAAATIVNAGLISAASTGSAGIVLVAGGSVTNQLSGTITGVDGVFANNAAATVVNAGGISGAFDAVLLKNGGTVFNQPLGTIDGADYGVKLSGTLASMVTNQGVIIGQAGAGVGMATGGTISNAASAVISGSSYGIDTYVYAATVINLGTIAGQGSAIDLFEGGSISNAASAAILAGDYGVKAAGTLAATVTNQGEIFGETRAGVVFLAGGSVNNAASAAILGGAYGVAAANTTATVMNQGTISGPGNIGVLFLDGGYVSNASTGTITGTYFGIQVSGPGASVTNFGSISSAAVPTANPGFDAAGVDLADGGTVINGPTGDIRATWKGVEIGAVGTNVGGTLLNQGVVYAGSDGGSVGADAWIHGPGLISNAATGTIAGGRYGVVAYYQTTVVNLGSIGGTVFAVSEAAGFADRVVVAPGATFSGIVSGGNTIGASVASTLELASGASAGTLTGLGTKYVEFATVTIDAGATWTWVSDAIGAGYTITDAGTLTNTGSLGSSVTLGVSAVLTNAAGGTITGTGTAAVDGAGGSATVVNAGLIDPATYGVYLPGGGSVTNISGGTIKGTASGVKISGGSGTVINAGTIVGGVSFGGTGHDLLVLDPSGVIASATASATASNTLELASGSSAGTVTGLGSQFINFGSLHFDPGADWFVAGNTAGLAGPITGFAKGDTIELDGITVTESSYSGGMLTLTDTTGVATLALAGSFSPSDFVVTNVAGGAEISLACFRAGTRILTNRGEAAVETLRVGDLVRTMLGETVAPIIWIGRREVDCARHNQPRNVWPVRVAAGAFGPGRPHTDLFLSPDHAIYINEVLIPIKHLINGSTIAQVQVDRVTYHHIELAQHDVLLAEGLPAESFLDMRDGSNYANRPGPVRLYPDFSARMWEAFACARLIVTGPELTAARSVVARFAAEQKAA